MTAFSLMDVYAQMQEWSLVDTLALALTYIENQKDNDAFEDFLLQVVANDQAAADEAPGR